MPAPWPRLRTAADAVPLAPLKLPLPRRQPGRRPPRPMSPDHAKRLDYLYSLLNYERAGMPVNPGELRLGRMRRLLRALGDPQRHLTIVHIAGTKGKGSTATLVAAALSASGRRTGLFCSPHLHRLEERFVVDGQPIDPDALIPLVDRVRAAAEVVDATDPHPGRRCLTFFEVTTAMGLCHFVQAGCETVVLEVGMGGRLDSTNCVRPAVSVITQISFDHTKVLGSTLAEIATQKAGIIKRRGTVVVGVRGEEPRAAIRTVVAQRRARSHWLDTDFHPHYQAPRPPLDRPTPGRVQVRTWRRAWPELELPLLGPHQSQNAATALAALDALADQGMEVSPEDVQRGWQGLSIPARVEILGARPWLVIDGAHNVASAVALAQTLGQNFPAGPRTLVFGTTRDKDLPGQLRALLPHFDRIVVTAYQENPRAVPPTEVRAAALGLGAAEAAVELAPDPAGALQTARRQTPADGLICVTGSLFLAAETRALLLGLTTAAPTTPSLV